jgi:hypothetical protein
MAAKKKSSARKASTASSSKKAFNLEAALDAVPALAAEQDLGMPADTFVTEARRALTEAQKHPGKFTALPDFDGSVFVVLPALIPRFVAAQKTWDQERFRVSRGTGRTSLRLEGEALRSRILASGRFLFRKVPDALLELDRIAEGQGIDDLITDLRDLVAFRNDNQSRWKQDTQLPKDAFARAAEIADALEGQVDTERALDARTERNKLAYLMDRALDEIRDGARYLFSTEPRRLAPFLSRYEAERRAASRRASRKAKGTTTDKPA